MMIYTLSPAVSELAGDALLIYLDRLPSSERLKVQGLAEFLKSLGSIRGLNGRSQAGSISLTVNVEDY